MIEPADTFDLLEELRDLEWMDTVTALSIPDNPQNSYCFVYRNDSGSIIGFVLAEPHTQDNSIYLGRVLVHEHYRRIGIGKALLQTLTTLLDMRQLSCTLDVSDLNTGALKLYGQFNFISEDSSNFNMRRKPMHDSAFQTTHNAAHDFTRDCTPDC